MLAVLHHSLHRRSCDAGEGCFGDRVVQHLADAAHAAATTHHPATAAHHPTATAHHPAAERAAQQLAEETGLLLAHLAGDLGQIARVLHAVIHAVAIHVREADAALCGALLQIPA